MVVNI